MSLINKMAKIQSNGAPGYGGGREVGSMRMIGPPAFVGAGGGGYGGRAGGAGFGPGGYGGRMLGPPTYMGDPGFFSFIGKAAKFVARAGTGVVSKLGIPIVSGVAGMASQILAGRGAIPGASTQPAPLAFQIPEAMPPGPTAMPGGITTRLGAEVMGPPQITGGVPASASMGGYHLNKSSYFLMDGTFIEAGTKWVKNRRRNPGNMRALSRSLGRIKSAKRMTAALSKISIRSDCPAPRRSRKK